MAPNDARLLSDARQGNEAAFLALYHRHRTPLFRFAVRLTGSVATAEDVAQECFLALLAGARFNERQGALRTYLFGVARHLSFKRARLSERETDEAAEAEAPLDTLGNLLAAERSALVERAIAELPPLQREALILFEYEELPLEEIAAIVGAEVGAVKARLHRARESLRKRLAPLLAPYRERSCS